MTSPDTGEGAQSWDAWPTNKVSGGRQKNAHSLLPALQRGKAARNTLLPPSAGCLSGSPALRWSGLPYSQSSGFQRSGCPSRSSFPSFQPLRSLQSVPSAQFSLRRGSKPLGLLRITSPEAIGGCGAFLARISERIRIARTPRRPNPVSYLEAALGLRALLSGALPAGTAGP